MTLKVPMSTFIVRKSRWIASPTARNDEIYIPRERLRDSWGNSSGGDGEVARRPRLTAVKLRVLHDPFGLRRSAATSRSIGRKASRRCYRISSARTVRKDFLNLTAVSPDLLPKDS